MSRIYQRLTTDLNLYEWTLQDEKDFELFREYVWKSDGGRLLLEFSFGKEIKEKIQFIKQIAIDTGFKLKDLLTLFMEKTVFKLFQIIGWSFKSLFELIKKGFQVYKDFQLAIADFIGNTKAIEWTKDKLIELDKFLKTHPKTKRIAGVAVAGLLVFVWLQMTFTGDFLDDFSIDAVFQALTGNYSLHEFFGTPPGIRMLMLFATGAITGLSFPWPGSSMIKFGIAVLTTLAKYFKKRLSKGNDLEQFESYKKVFKENYDLKSRYKFFNKLYFNNKLPNDIPVYISTKKRNRGSGAAIPNKECSNIESLRLTDLSNQIVPEILNDVYDAILIHEMVHGYMFILYGKEMQKNPHGKNFNDVLRAIVKKGNFKFLDYRKPAQLGKIPYEYWIKTEPQYKSDLDRSLGLKSGMIG